jgi:hypothetical protein
MFRGHANISVNYSINGVQICFTQHVYFTCRQCRPIGRYRYSTLRIEGTGHDLFDMVVCMLGYARMEDTKRRRPCLPQLGTWLSKYSRYCRRGGQCMLREARFLNDWNWARIMSLCQALLGSHVRGTLCAYMQLNLLYPNPQELSNR